MKEITQFAGRTVEIWRRPRQRNMNLRVRPDGTLRVTCAKRIPELEIFRFISDSKAYIEKALAHYTLVRNKFPPKIFAAGENFLILGRHVPLDLFWSWEASVRVTLTSDRLEMVVPLASTSHERQAAFHKYLQQQAKVYFSKRMADFEVRMGVRATALNIRGQKTRWGSCSSNGQISLNWKLLAAPSEVIDYVIVHELAHLAHMDHSPRFWALVEKYFPDYRSTKKWLIEFEPEIARQFLKIANA